MAGPSNPSQIPGLLSIAPPSPSPLVPTKILDLKTNLKNLRFGNDRPGGGSSNSPYIESPIPDNASPAEQLIIDAARYSYDFPIRGGALAPINSIKDLLRISKFLQDAPKGPLFIAKQELLQLSNPKIETGKIQLGINSIENTRAYNFGINTLAQVPVNAFGIHLDRAGLFPVMNDQDKYFYIVKNKSTNENRLVLLKNSKIDFNPYINNSNLTDLGISSNKDLIMDYWGGPGSTIGILGRTTIKRTPEQTSNFKYNSGNRSISNNSIPEKTHYFSFLNSTYSKYRYNRPISPPGAPTEDQTDISNSNRPLGTIGMDFRKIFNVEEANSTVLPYSDYEDPKIKMESRIRIGNPGKINRSRIDYNVSDPDTVDQINAQPLIRNEDFEQNTLLGRDLIKFRFESIDSINPSNGIVILFRAFLDNISDSNSANWTAFNYTGRGENFYTYNNFTRTLNFSFKIAAQSRDEMKPLYQKLNYLISNLAPDYDTIFMSGPLMRLTIGDYIYRQPGFLTSLNINIDNNTPWEIALTSPESGPDKDMYELPQFLQIDALFTPIHSFLVRRYTKAPFITPPGSDNKFLKDINV